MSDGLLRMVMLYYRSMVGLLLEVQIGLVFCWEYLPVVVTVIGFIDCVGG